jgi:hypothetical protein
MTVCHHGPEPDACLCLQFVGLLNFGQEDKFKPILGNPLDHLDKLIEVDRFHDVRISTQLVHRQDLMILF